MTIYRIVLETINTSKDFGSLAQWLIDLQRGKIDKNDLTNPIGKIISIQEVSGSNES